MPLTVMNVLYKKQRNKIVRCPNCRNFDNKLARSYK